MRSQFRDQAVEQSLISDGTVSKNYIHAPASDVRKLLWNDFANTQRRRLFRTNNLPLVHSLHIVCHGNDFDRMLTNAERLSKKQQTIETPLLTFVELLRDDDATTVARQTPKVNDLVG